TPVVKVGEVRRLATVVRSCGERQRRLLWICDYHGACWRTGELALVILDGAVWMPWPRYSINGDRYLQDARSGQWNGCRLPVGVRDGKRCGDGPKSRVEFDGDRARSLRRQCLAAALVVYEGECRIPR